MNPKALSSDWACLEPSLPVGLAVGASSQRQIALLRPLPDVLTQERLAAHGQIASLLKKACDLDIVPAFLRQGGDFAEQEALVMGVVARGVPEDQDGNRGRQVPGQFLV